MIKKTKFMGGFAALVLSTLLLVACDDEGESSSGGGSAASSSNTNPTVVDLSDSESQSQAAAPASMNSKVTLDAFKDFNCTSNWKNRDGGLGLVVGSGSGTCKATFPGGEGLYQIQLLAQTEREGQSPYIISINGKPVASGKFPFSQGKVNCNCERDPWQVYCPDVVMPLDAGVHMLKPGDTIEYYGEEEYLCGKHGAYSKWKGMEFFPAN